MTIRDATPADEAAVRACAEAAYARYVEAIGRPPAPMVADFAAQIRDGQVRVAVGPEGRVVGYAVRYPKDGAMHLENVAVLPSETGRGIGRALIADCEAAARAADLPAVELYTNAKMVENLSIYLHLGYRQTGRRVEGGFDRVFFRKEMAAGAGG